MGKVWEQLYNWWAMGGYNIQNSMLSLHWENTNSKSKKLQRNISDNYDSTFVIVQMSGLLKQRRRIQKRLYVRFSTILGPNFRRLLFINEGAHDSP